MQTEGDLNTSIPGESDQNLDDADQEFTNSDAPRQRPQHATDSSSKKRKSSASDCVQVAVRIRPLLPLERQEPCMNILDEPIGANFPDQELEEVATSVQIGGRRSGVTYTFDCVYGSNTTQSQLYLHSVVPLLNACLEGYNATILAYGQTGSGKTHTIMGNHVTGELQGVLPRTIHALFDALSGSADENHNPQSAGIASSPSKQNSSNTPDRPCDDWKVKVQFLEIYGEDIRDLLKHERDHDDQDNINEGASFKISIRDGGPQDEPEILGANKRRVHSAEEALQMLQTGRMRRVTAATAMNATSSRSHALFTIMVEQEWKKGQAEGGGSIRRRSKFHFVDLAGSERQKRTQAEGQRLKEGIEINKGLLVLGNVIAALASSSSFIPYRDSKLTRMLRGSLGGNHKTLMIACVSPSADNVEESLNCLRYANRAKQIQNKAIINLDPTSQYIQTLQQHIVKLAQQALRQESEPSVGQAGGTYSTEQLRALAAGENIEAVMAGLQVPESASESDTEVPKKNEVVSQPEIQYSKKIPADDAEEALYWQNAQSSVHSIFHGRGSSSGEQSDSDIQDTMMQRMIEYEREIGELKKALIAEQAQRAMAQEDQAWVDEVQQSLHRDRSNLEHLQNTVDDQDINSKEAESDLEAEEEAEQAAVKKWTKKYSGKKDDDDDDDDDDDTVSSNPVGSPRNSSPSTGKHREIQDDLLELARSITAKEELIGQLKTSQERYEQMREFYEEKLKQMEHSLLEKEEERESLVKKLQEAEKAKNSVAKSMELREKLRKKEEHITVLKKKSAELRHLTTISSRNANEISRLSRDVEDMKRRKVDLQRLLASERKAHQEEIKRMNKEALQRDRELNKLKRHSNKLEIEADRANKIAKSRLEELGALRLKYKDTEKKLRVQSVKRGVRAKAGIDPVMVGQREKSKQSIDTNALRDLFDEKVSEVARKEALVNKLAEEWEQHFQLTAKRDEVAANDSPEDLENLDLQLKWKEDRIRNLAKKLEKEHTAEQKLDPKSANEAFLFDAQFNRLCRSASSDEAHKSLAKVLFGMVVRERRRVAALARTACSLDEKLQATEDELDAKESALRSYMDEQKLEVAELSQTHQNQIFSLMELVKEDASGASRVFGDNSRNGLRGHGGTFDETLLVLANERILALENQVETIEAETELTKVQKIELKEAKDSLRASEKENKALSAELGKLIDELHRIKVMISKSQIGREDLSNVEAAVDRVLGSTSSADVSSKNPSTPSPSKVRPLPAAIRDIDLSESEGEDDDGPDWANDIMQDLALIAEGKVPPSLLSSPDFQAAEDTSESSVFERLNNPANFTGTHKAKNKTRARTKSQSSTVSDSAQGEQDTLARPIISSTDDSKLPAERTPSKAKPRTRPHSSRMRQSSAMASRGRSSMTSADSSRRPSGAARTTSRRDDNSVKSAQSKPSSTRKEKSGSVSPDQSEDVFERLSHKTTFAFSVRQNGVPDQDNGPAPLKVTSVDSMLDQVLGTSSYGNQESGNVFERLSKKTTEAYAMKVNRNNKE